MKFFIFGVTLSPLSPVIPIPRKGILPLLHVCYSYGRACFHLHKAFCDILIWVVNRSDHRTLPQALNLISATTTSTPSSIRQRNSGINPHRVQSRRGARLPNVAAASGVLVFIRFFWYLMSGTLALTRFPAFMTHELQSPATTHCFRSREDFGVKFYVQEVLQSRDCRAPKPKNYSNTTYMMIQIFVPNCRRNTAGPTT